MEVKPLQKRGGATRLQPGGAVASTGRGRALSGKAFKKRTRIAYRRFSCTGYTKHRLRGKKRNSGAANRIKTKTIRAFRILGNPGAWKQNEKL